MKAIVHYPKTAQGIKELQKKAAQVHSQSVKDYVTQLPCSNEQKIDLLQSIIDSRS